MKSKLKKQNGITLVALVITIIVLLILAMVSIRIVMDGGLITKASKSTDTHTVAAEKEAITTGYAAYQIDSIKTEKTESPTLLIKGATATPKGEGWNVTFTKTNNEYQLSKNGEVLLAKQNGIDVIWTDNGDDTFTKGDVTVKVGDIVNYDEGTGYSTTVTASKSGYTDDQRYTTENLGWRVLGINSKGEIELISDNPTSGLTLHGETGYLNAEEVLNNMCNELYGKGKHATGARSLNIEDINKLANYDPTTYSLYGEIWTYRFPTSGNYMQYRRTTKNGILRTDWKDTTDSSYQTFRPLGEKEIISEDNRNDTGRSFVDTFYGYNIADKVKQTTGDGKKMSDIILNGTGNINVEQWLASQCICCDSRAVRFFIRYIGDNDAFRVLYKSNNRSDGFKTKIRPVVSLESDIQLSGNSTDGWTIN